ncbi:hypothetical protein ACFL1E_02600 [Candidatus Omnitrophota bacterium]
MKKPITNFLRIISLLFILVVVVNLGYLILKNVDIFKELFEELPVFGYIWVIAMVAGIITTIFVVKKAIKPHKDK